MDKDKFGLVDKIKWATRISIELDLKITESKILDRLAFNANTSKGNLCWLKKENLAEESRVGKRTLDKSLKILAEIGLIEIIRDHQSQIPEINKYMVNRRASNTGRIPDIWKVNFDFDIRAHKTPKTPIHLTKNNVSPFMQDLHETNSTFMQHFPDLKVTFMQDFHPNNARVARNIYIDRSIIKDIRENEENILSINSPHPPNTEVKKIEIYNSFLLCLREFQYQGNNCFKTYLEDPEFLCSMQKAISLNDPGFGFPINHLTYIQDSQNDRLDWAKKFGFHIEPVRNIKTWLPKAYTDDFQMIHIPTDEGAFRDEFYHRKHDVDNFDNWSSVYYIKPTRELPEILETDTYTPTQKTRYI